MPTVDQQDLSEDPISVRPGVSGDQRIQSAVLEGLASAVNYRRWYVELALPYLGDDPIEIGSGLGDYALEWASRLPRFTATEADPDRLEQLRARAAAMPSLQVRPMMLPTQEKAGYSGLVSYNVLEHVEDDVEALRSMARLVTPGGAVVLIVPAFQFAMSPLDVAVGHVRRYTKKSLSKSLGEAGLVIERMRYVNALGLPCYYLSTSLFRVGPRAGTLVRIFDRLVLPVTKSLERVVPPPWGQSVFVVARVSEL